MASDQQIAANRLNAQKSTGPRTAEGKAQVGSNALKHGLTGKQIVLPDENPKEFDSFRAGLLNELNPSGELEGLLAERIVVDSWRLRRVPALEAMLYKGSYELDAREGNDSSVTMTFVAHNCWQVLGNLWRHEAALHRSFSRSLHELQRLQAIRAGERVPAPAAVDVDIIYNWERGDHSGVIYKTNPIGDLRKQRVIHPQAASVWPAVKGVVRNSVI